MKYFITGAITFLVGWFALSLFNQKPQVILSPVIESCVADCIKIEEEVKPFKSWEGKASWYGEADDECLGCRDDRLMANGERFDERKNTVAFNRLPLGSLVRITNIHTAMWEVARVTDTGGFEDLDDPRIVDLSKGLKNRLHCTDLCDVIVEEVIL